MSSIKAAIAWGVDLGYEDDERARMFAELGEEGSAREIAGSAPLTWELAYYGWQGTRRALVLGRSLQNFDAEDEDHSLEDFLVFSFENGDFSMRSQPDDAELAQLKKLMEATPEAQGRDDLILTVLLLPSYG